MRGVLQAKSKPLAIFPNLNVRCLSVRTKIPGDISQFGCEVFFGQDQNSWRYLPVKMRGHLSEPKFLAVFPSLNGRRFFSRGQNSSRYLPVWMRGVFRSEPKLLAVFTSPNARCLPVRTETPGDISSLNVRCLLLITEIPGDISQARCELLVCQNQNVKQYSPVLMRGAFRSEPKFLAT